MKKQLHSCRVRIRNNLVAQYFPELDWFWNNAEAENLDRALVSRLGKHPAAEL